MRKNRVSPPRLTTLLRGADRKRVRVEDPLHRIGRTEFAVEIGRACRVGDKELLAVVGDLLNRQAYRRDRNVDDQIDLVGVVPLPRDARGNIGLDLMIGGNDGNRLAQNFAAEIFDRHLRRRDRTGARCSRRRPR